MFEQLIAHLLGDYFLQTDWMAQAKTKRWWPAIAHALSYGLPFLFITHAWPALVVIVLTHLIIDHWRLARYVIWFKNLFSPAAYRYPWKDCNITGYYKDRSIWLATWLMIITDNTMHIIINFLAIKYLG
jgi:hypothetical protein